MTITDLILHPGIILLIILLVLSFFIYLIDSLIFKRKFKKTIKEYSDFHNPNGFILKIDTSRSDWRIFVFYRRQGIITKKFLLSEYLTSIFQMDRGVFQNYVETIIKDKKLPKLTLRHTNLSITLKTNNYRREYLMIKKIGEVAYFRCQDFILESSKEKLTIKGIEEFKKSVRSLTREQNTIQGTLICLQLLSQEQVLARYNIGIASQYAQAFISRFMSLASKLDIISCCRGNRYYIYAANLTNRKQALALIKRLKTSFAQPINILGFKLAVEINYGIAFNGEFTTDVDELIAKSEQAVQEAINSSRVIDTLIYDSELESENIKHQRNRKKVERMIESRAFTCMYAPVFNLSESKTIGYRIKFIPDSIFFTMDQVRAYASESNLGKSLNVALASSLFSHFFFKKNTAKDLMYLVTTIDEVADYLQVYLANADYRQMGLAIIVSDYKYFKEKEINNSLINTIKNNGIALYALADDSMLISDHPILNHLDGLVFDSTIFNLVDKDNVHKLEMVKILDRFSNFKYHYLAFDVDKYSKLDIIKSLKIDLIEGDLVAKFTNNPVAVTEVKKKNRHI